MVAILYPVLAISGLFASSHASPITWFGRSSQNLAAQQPTQQGLPSNGNATFKYVGLGVGVQNYTCASPDATPVATGALATLFDATEFFTNFPALIDHVSQPYLQMYEAQGCTKYGNPNVADDSCEERANFLHLPVLGHHYFANVNSKGVPSFDITHSGDYLSCAKYGDVKAPSNAYAGQNKAGAVDWLFLADNAKGLTHGLKEVYRVQTQGGSPVAGACSSGASSFGVKYAAEYWFYN